MFNQQLGSKTTNEQLHCLCNHLSAFGGSIFVAPNPIDFDTVFIKFTKLGETKNVVVLATVCVITGIYFIGLVFARRADKNDNFKVSVNIYHFTVDSYFRTTLSFATFLVVLPMNMYTELSR